MMNNNRINVLVMDVDGTLTDGKIYIGENGEAFKVFNIKDGYAIKNLLSENGIIPVVISARESILVERRCRELEINELYQGVENKCDILLDVINRLSRELGDKYSLSSCAYIGDDLIDLPCMLLIKNSGGVAGCPNDAVDEVKNAVDYVSSNSGGDGAVRDFVEWIIKKKETK